MEGWKEFPATRESYDAMLEFVTAAGEMAGFSVKGQMKLELAFEEAVVNIISYAYPEGKGSIWLRTLQDGDTFSLDVVDHGIAFDPLEHNRLPDAEAPLEERQPGGYGVMFMKKIFPELSYVREPLFGAEANHLRLSGLIF